MWQDLFFFLLRKHKRDSNAMKGGRSMEKRDRNVCVKIVAVVVSRAAAVGGVLRCCYT